MKIFNKKSDSWSENLNFVDENNVVLGYDYSQDWCEQFGYWFSSDPQGKEKLEELEIVELDAFVFDTSYFEEDATNEYFEEGGSMTFRMAAGVRELFLTLYNGHNGYYGHGWDITEHGKILESGRL